MAHKLNIEALWFNHCYPVKAINIAYSEFLSAAVLI